MKTKQFDKIVNQLHIFSRSADAITQVTPSLYYYKENPEVQLLLLAKGRILVFGKYRIKQGDVTIHSNHQYRIFPRHYFEHFYNKNISLILTKL